MSNVIDERVVSMQFDNRNFEHNARTSMGTLEKLKQSLNLSGASKGLENISSAVRNINLNPLGDAIETVKVKFSSLQIMAVTALQNITNKAVDAGEKMIKSLSVDQITAGWSKYEQKTASVQTILNATGKSIDEVNEYLDKLMWFSDETSYGFTDMTRALATMTSSGGDIEKLIPMIMGVANATAFAGKGPAEFGRLMQYGINQAYSLGHMQVRDWMSIESATVGSKQLVETLIRAGEELGKIEKGSIDTSSFRNSLADKWLDKEVMEKGFGEFAEMSEKAFEMVNSGIVDTASEAYEKLSEQYDTISLTAAKAAQEAKTFTEAIDATKDAVSSGWLNTFEIIFGNYEEAKEMWTGLANYLWDVFASGAESRNSMLEEVFRGTPVTNLKKKLKGVIGITEDATATMEDLSAVVEKVINGDYGNGRTRWDKLAQEGYDWAKVQNLVNEAQGSSVRHVEQVVEAQEEQLTQLENLTDAKLEELGLTEDEIKLYRELESAAKDCGMTMAEYLETNKEVDRRTKLLEAFGKIGEHIMTIIDAMKEGWKRVFGSDMGSALAGVIDKFIEWVDNIDLGVDAIENITSAVQGFCSAIQLGTILGGGLFGVINRIIQIVERTTDMTVWDILGRIGDAITGFKQALIDDSSFTQWLEDVFTLLATGLTTVLTAVRGFVDDFKKLEFVQEFISKFSGTLLYAFDRMLEWINGFREIFSQFFKEIRSFDSLTFENVISAITNLGRNILNHFGGLERVFAAPLEAIVDFGDGLLEHLGLGNDIFTNAVAGIKKFCKWVGNALSGVLDWFAGMKDAEDLPKYVAEGIVSAFDWAIETIKTLFVNLWKSITEGSSDGSLVGSIAEGLWKGIKFIGEVAWELGKIIFERLTDPKNIDGVIRTIFGAIRTIATQLNTWITGELASAGDNTIAGFIGGIWNGISGLASVLWKIGTFIYDTVCGVLGIHSPSRVFMTIGAMCIAGLVLGLTNGESTIGETLGGFINTVKTSGLWEAIETYFGKITDYIGNIKFEQLAGIAGIAILAYFAVLIYKALDIISDGIKSVNGVLDGIHGIVVGVKKVLNSFSDAITRISKSVAFSMNMSAIKNFAIAIAILAGAIAALALIGMQPGGTAALLTAGGIVVVLAGVLAGIFVAMNKVTSPKKGKSKTAVVALKDMLFTLMGIAAAILLMAAAAKMIGSLNWENGEFARGIGGLIILSGLMVGLMAATDLMAKSTSVKTAKTERTSQNVEQLGKTISKIAMSMIGLAVALKIVSSIPEEKFLQGLAGIGFMTAMMIGLMAATNLMAKTTSSNKTKLGKTESLEENSSNPLKNIASTITSIALAMIGLSAALAIVSSIPEEKFLQGLAGIGFMTAMMIGLMAATNLMAKTTESSSEKIGKTKRSDKDSSNPLKNIASTITSIALAMIGLSAALAIVSSIPEEKFLQGLAGIGFMTAMMIGLMAATNLMAKTTSSNKTKLGKTESLEENSSNPLKNIASTITSVALAMIGLSAALAIVSSIPEEKFLQGLAGIGFMTAMMIGLMAATDLLTKKTSVTDVKSTESIDKIGTTIMGVALGILALSAALKIMSTIPWNQLWPGIVGMIVLGGVVVGLMAATKLLSNKELAKLGPTIMAMALAILIMSGAAMLLSLCDLGTMIPAALAVGVLAAAMSLMIKATKGAKNCHKNLIVMTVAIGVMAMAIAALSFIKNPTAVLNSAASLGLVMLALAGSMWIIGQIKDMKGMMGTIIGLAALVATLGGALTLLSLLHPENIFQSALALGVTMLALSGSVWIISQMKNVSGMVGTIVSLSLLIAILGGALTLLSLLHPENVLQSAVALGLVMLALAGAVAIISNFGSGVGVVGTLLAMSVAIIALAGGLFILAQADPARLGTALGVLCGALLAITVVLAVLAVVFTTFAPGAALVVGALLALAAVIATVALAAISFGLAAQMFANAIVTVGAALPMIANGLTILVNAVVDLSSKAWEFVGTALILSIGLAALSMSVLGLSAGMLLVGIGALIFATALLLVGPALALVQIGLAGIGIGLQSLIESVANSSGLVGEFAATLLKVGDAMLVFLIQMAAGLIALGAGALVGGAGLVVLGAGLAIVGVALVIVVAGVALLAGAMYIAGAAVYFMADAVNYLGLAISQGLAQGIADGISIVTEAVGGLANGIIGTICNVLGIHSPSTVGMNIGQFFGEGVSIGLDNSSAGVTSSAAGLGSAGSDSFMSSMSGGIDLSSIDMGSFDTSSLNSMMNGAGKSGGSSLMSGLSGSIDINSLTSGFDFGSITSMFGGAGEDAGSSFASGFTTEGMTGNMDDMLSSISDYDPQFSQAGRNTTAAYSGGVRDAVNHAVDAITEVITAACATARNDYFNWLNAGSYLVDGFAAGITANTFKAQAAATAMAYAALRAAREALKINSPSKVFREIGTSVPEGFAMGIDRLGYVVKDSTSSMASTAIDGTKSAIARIAEAIDADIDSQPTIRPVMDLSAVTEGANSISNMLSMTPSMEMLTNVGTISSMMNSRQNVGNGDVLSALKDLKSSLSGRTGDTISINGITYDDGSNIAEAVKTLVRAAKIERRV